MSDKGKPKKSSTALVIMKVLEPRQLSENETNSSPEFVGDNSSSASSGNGSVGNTVVSVTENEMIGRVITIMSASDDDSDSLSIHLLPEGNTNGIFAVNEGALTVARRIDYEEQNKFHLRLAVTDGLDYTYLNVSTFHLLMMISRESLPS